jgi:hypothetical protein
MSMSTSLIGIIPADEKFKKMAAVYKACEDVGVDIPSEVDDYFEDGRPNPKGIEVDLDNNDLAVKKLGGERGYFVDLTKLSPDIKYIEFVNSW